MTAMAARQRRSRRLERAGQDLPPPGGRREGAGFARPAQRRALGRRSRRGLVALRLRHLGVPMIRRGAGMRLAESITILEASSGGRSRRDRRGSLHRPGPRRRRAERDNVRTRRSSSARWTPHVAVRGPGGRHRRHHVQPAVRSSWCPALLADAGNADEEVHDRKIEWIARRPEIGYAGRSSRVFAIGDGDDERDAHSGPRRRLRACHDAGWPTHRSTTSARSTRSPTTCQAKRKRYGI